MPTIETLIRAAASVIQLLVCVLILVWWCALILVPTAGGIRELVARKVAR